jgi:uracil-DNA glycosylase family 4
VTTETLETIAADVRMCPKCPLAHTRTHAVPGEGSPNSEVFFIGEGPGYNEDQQGRPFVGAAGHLLNEMIEHIGLRRQDVFITNVVRCRPPQNRDPQPDELAACDEYTQRQLTVLQPRLIVTLGRFSMAKFFGKGTMKALHGTTVEWNGMTCIAMYHPAAILRGQTAESRRAYAEDFEKIPPLLERLRKEPQKPPPRQETASPEPEQEPPDQLSLF